MSLRVAINVPDEIRRLLSGSDPTKIPLWLSGIQLSATPEIPSYIPPKDGTNIEYLFGFPIFMMDDQSWPELTTTLSNKVEIRIHKPIATWAALSPPGARGNESIDLGFTTFPVSSDSVNVDEHEAFEVVRRCLQWIRVGARQHWVLTGIAAPYAACRGTSFNRKGLEVAQNNFVGYGRGLAMKSLRKEEWVRIGSLLGIAPPVSESIFCDAVNSFLLDDCVKCLLELGVAAEVEIIRLMDELETASPQSSEAIEYRRRKADARDSFRWKFTDLAVGFGLPILARTLRSERRRNGLRLFLRYTDLAERPHITEDASSCKMITAFVRLRQAN